MTEGGVTGQTIVSVARAAARGKNINIERAPIHPRQARERTVEEKRGRERNVNWVRAKVR